MFTPRIFPQVGPLSFHPPLYVLSSFHLASPPAALKVLPDSSQHLQGEEFSLDCSGHSGETKGWTLRRFPGAEVNSSYLHMGDRFNLGRNNKYSFNNITAGLSGLYWCETARGDQRSNAVNITVNGELNIPHLTRPHSTTWHFRSVGCCNNLDSF